MNSETGEAARLAYLDAMGVSVWRPRDAADPVAADAPQPEMPADPVATDNWASLQQAVAACTLCELHKSRTQTVFGTGSTQADLLVIGEAPGADEDRRGEPFVGPAGQLLDEMLRIAAQQLLGNDLPLGRMRGQVHTLESAGVPVVVTYHPAYLLRTPAHKRKAWHDLCVARDLLQGQPA